MWSGFFFFFLGGGGGGGVVWYVLSQNIKKTCFVSSARRWSRCFRI